MDDGLRIRDATADDLADVRRLFNALIPTTTGTWREHLASEEEMAAWFAERRAMGHPVLVAELDVRVVGYCCWTSFRGGDRFPGYRTTVEHTIHVDERHHGAGVGRRLLAALEERAVEAGVHVLVAAIDSENRASIDFHAALGFREVARMPELGRKFGRWLELVLMQRIVAGD